MNGLKAERTQTDGKQEEYSRKAGLDFSEDIPENKSKTRLDQQADTSIERMLIQHGVIQRPQAPQYKDVDYTLDLQEALHAIAEAKSMYARLPEGLRERYRSWQALLNAIEDGSLNIDFTPGDDPKWNTAPESSKQPTASSASAPAGGPASTETPGGTP